MILPMAKLLAQPSRTSIASERHEFSKLNPLNYVPVLVDEGKVIADSLAIILYLEEKYPQHPLLPQDIHKKAINFQYSEMPGGDTNWPIFLHDQCELDDAMTSRVRFAK
ncbi:Glutathione S-transferase zeta-1 [Asimina triloba]